MREHLKAAWNETGRRPEGWIVAPLPDEAKHLWEAFAELHRARRHNGFGPEPLSFADMDAWARLTGQRLDPWELRALLKVDSLYLASTVEKGPPTGA